MLEIVEADVFTRSVSGARSRRKSILSIMAAWAVDREFVHIVGPAGAPFGRLGPHPIGTLLGRLWLAFGHLGTPLGSM